MLVFVGSTESVLANVMPVTLNTAAACASRMVTLLLSTVVPSVFGSLSFGVTATCQTSPTVVSWLTIVVECTPAFSSANV